MCLFGRRVSSSDVPIKAGSPAPRAVTEEGFLFQITPRPQRTQLKPGSMTWKPMAPTAT